MALAEVDDLRLLFDPLLADRHHGGVFEVVPPREVHDRELRADFIFVSHRHPDHFDLSSLRRLAELDADSVVITPDALIERCCSRLGFRTVRRIGPRTRLELDTVCVLTTPSRANDEPIAPDALEFGVAIKTDAGAVWNCVDTVHKDRRDLTATLDSIESALEARLALAFVPWCPLLEIEAFTAGRIGFPFASYGEILEDAAVIAGRGAAIVPSSAGARHAAPFQQANALVYPLDEDRFRRDLALRVANVRTWPAGVGGTFAIEADGISFARGSSLVTLGAFREDRAFKPLTIPPLKDSNPGARSEETMRSDVERWVRVDLAPHLRRRSHVLEVVYPSTRDVFTLRDGVVTRDDDPQWDLRNEVAGSFLCDVIEGRRHWGDLLLAGLLRACSRAYDVGPRGLVRANVSPIFLYQAISYTASVERALEHELAP